MKTLNLSRIAGLTTALVITSILLARTGAEEPMKPMKGGEHQLMLLQEVKTGQELDKLKTGDTLTMVCSKCKTVWTTRVKQGTKGAEILSEGGLPKEIVGSHACKGCNSTLTVVGGGKAKTDVLKHSCKSCGDESAFCCAGKSHGHEHAEEREK